MPTRREFLKLAAAGSAGLVAAAAGRACSAEPVSPPRRPHILFLMADQHRADCLGCSGNSVIKTPNLDRIAREGVRFTHAYSSTPSCTPARAAILTGLSPWHHGMLGYGEVAERYPLELPRAMADAGYRTFAIGKLHYHPQRNYHGFHGALLDGPGPVQLEGFTSDYLTWFKEKAPDLDPNVTGIGRNDYRSREYALPEELHQTRWTGDMAVDYVTKYDHDEPMFLKVSFSRPHSPYDPPKRFWDMYRDSDMPAPRVGKWAEHYAPVDPKTTAPWHGDYGIDQARASRRGYYGAVSFIDEQIGRILKALEQRGMLDNTLIVYTADHGDMLGDHHLWRKTYAYEGSADIPMLLRWPKGMFASHSLAPQRAGEGWGEGGRCSDAVVELRDLLPTFLDTAGASIPCPSETDATASRRGGSPCPSETALDGMSLLRLVRGETSDWRDCIDLEHDICYSRDNHWNALTDGRWKYIYHAYDGREQLFDMENDPGELKDLASDTNHQWTLKSWRNRLAKHFAERGEQWVSGGSLVPRPKPMLYSPMYPKGPAQ